MFRSGRRALAAALVLLALTSCVSSSASKPSRTRVVEVRARPGDLRTIPQRPPDALPPVQKELAALVTDVYSRAFLPPIRLPKRGTAVPTPMPRPPVGELFTEDARAALEASMDAFRSGEGTTVTSGTVDFSGVVTADPDPTSALLSVAFAAPATLFDGSRTVRARLRQSGQLLCLRTDAGWRVAGFDVRLEAERVVPPSPSPSAVVPPSPIAASFMPASGDA